LRKLAFTPLQKKAFTTNRPDFNRSLLLSSGVSAPISTFILGDNPEKSPILAK
jgi:hypothetical protein